MNRNRAKAISLLLQGHIDLFSLQVYLTNLDPKVRCEECNTFARYTGFSKSGDVLRYNYYCHSCAEDFNVIEKS